MKKSIVPNSVSKLIFRFKKRIALQNYLTFLIGPMKIVTISQDGSNMLSTLIERRVRMEYSDESEDEKSLHSQNMYSF